MKKVCLLIVVFTLCAAFYKADAQKAPTLNHIALYVKDLNTSTSFYRDIVGLDTIPEPFHDGRHTWFKVGEHSHLHLIQGAKEIIHHDKNSHLCFSVESMDQFIKVLTNNNIAYEAWNGTPNTKTHRVDGVKQIYFQDPDNYWVEINDDKY